MSSLSALVEVDIGPRAKQTRPREVARDVEREVVEVLFSEEEPSQLSRWGTAGAEERREDVQRLGSGSGTHR